MINCHSYLGKTAANLVHYRGYERQLNLHFLFFPFFWFLFHKVVFRFQIPDAHIAFAFANASASLRLSRFSIPWMLVYDVRCNDRK
jgi:hypothetical protein